MTVRPPNHIHTLYWDLLEHPLAWEGPTSSLYFFTFFILFFLLMMKNMRRN